VSVPVDPVPPDESLLLASVVPELSAVPELDSGLSVSDAELSKLGSPYAATVSDMSSFVVNVPVEASVIDSVVVGEVVVGEVVVGEVVVGDDVLSAPVSVLPSSPQPMSARPSKMLATPAIGAVS
jgi:hypothetical protein